MKTMSIPPKVANNPNSEQIISGWVNEGGLHVGISSGFDDPGAWGVVLADIVRNVVDLYSATAGLDRAAVKDAMKEVLLRELDTVSASQALEQQLAPDNIGISDRDLN